MRLGVSLVCGLALIFGACSSTDGGIDAESSTSSISVSVTDVSASSTTTTTTTAATTSESQPTDSSSPSERFAVDLTNVPEPPPEPDSRGALGSGCAPGTDILPDGVWAGWVISREEDRVEFDLACMHPTPEEPSITNQTSRLRSVPVSTSAVVYPVTDEGLLGEPIPYPTWRSSPTSVFCASLMITPSLPDGCPLWLYVNEGAVTEIAEFWLP